MEFHFNLIGSLGLVLDIFGAILLFKYGLPSEIQDEVNYPVLSAGKPYPVGNVEKVKKENKKIRFRSALGIILLIFGFILQLINTNLSFVPRNSVPEEIPLPTQP